MHRLALASTLAAVAVSSLQAQAGPSDGWPAPPVAAELSGSRSSLKADDRAGQIALDGRLDDRGWQSASPIYLNVQGQPVEGAPAEVPTAVRLVFDDEALYVGARMFDPAPDQIANQLVRRDEWGQYDYIEVSLDPNRDRRTGYQFRVSAAGVQRDVYLYDDVREDVAWNAVWQSKVLIDSLGWTAELRIPLSQIRYNPTDSAQTWGINFSRRRLASNEITYLALESRTRHGKVSVFADLDDIRVAGSGRRIEIRPYVLSSARAAQSALGDPFFDGSAMRMRAGADVRIGLGSSHTADVTINPDFGQVEVDPAVVNLSAFETFFPEQRPFFVEDGQIFDFELSGRQNQLFYSRRIGRSPQGRAPSGYDFVETSDATSILGAAKLTGRTSGGLSMGVLAAVTGDEYASVANIGGAEIERYPVEPRSRYGAVRVRQDFRGGATTVGGMLTAADRGLPDDGRLDFLAENAYALGLDFEHSWGGARSRDWALSGFWAGTHVRGMPEAITRIQRSSNHYFQRPDATRFGLDSAATSLSGMDWRLELNRRSAKHWTGGVWVGQTTPGFEVNDLGFSRNSERLDIGGRLSYSEIRPGKIFRNYRISAFTFQNFRHEALDDVWSLAVWRRAHKRGAFSLSANAQFLNYWGVNLNVRHSLQTLSDNSTRGGPLMVSPASTSVSVRGNTDRRSAVAFEPSLSYEMRVADGYEWGAGLEVTVRPAASWELEFEPTFRAEREPAQYVATTQDIDYQPTYGRRYIFSDLERRSASLETRLNVGLSPTLTVQLFAQPLISAGTYLTTKLLDQAESFAFETLDEGTASITDDGVACVDGRTCLDGETRSVDLDGDGAVDYSFGNRDFTLRSLRMNLVVRWEWRPGSTLFLVWQQTRGDRDRTGTFDLGRDVGDLFGAAAENRFIVKFNYWLGL